MEKTLAALQEPTRSALHEGHLFEQQNNNAIPNVSEFHTKTTKEQKGPKDHGDQRTEKSRSYIKNIVEKYGLYQPVSAIRGTRFSSSCLPGETTLRRSQPDTFEASINGRDTRKLSQKHAANTVHPPDRH